MENKFPTMTVHECAEAFRANRISISEPVLAAEIIAGIYPFATGIQMREAVIHIYRHKFYKWLDEMIGTEATRI